MLEICKQFSENIDNESLMNRAMFHVVVLFSKFSDMELVALSLTAEIEGIDSEKWL